ncbi:MAG: hypothetical protein MJ168_03060 [Clostridia bacterium]|nr:hypothetical protein [Clostridia bacterium]
MKLKFNFKEMMPLVIALAVLVIAVPVRVAQYLTIIDAKTGFFNEINFSVVLLYVVLGAGLVLGLVIPFLRHKTLKPAPLATKSVGFTVVSLIMAITLIIDSAIQLMNYFDMFTAATGYIGKSVSEYVAMQGGTILMLQAIIGALSAIYFFVSGVTIGLGNSDSSKYKVFALLPTVWCIFKLLYRFKRTISFVNVSDLLLELFCIVFSMMFLFALAQVNSKIDIKEKGDDLMQSVYWKIFGYGIPAAVFALVCFLPRFILLVTGNSDHINSQYNVNVSDLGFAVFAIYTCISALKAKETAIEE